MIGDRGNDGVMTWCGIFRWSGLGSIEIEGIVDNHDSERRIPIGLFQAC